MIIKIVAAAAIAMMALSTMPAMAADAKGFCAKLCPNPEARCMARDNPDFYKQSDPAFYKRIIKCQWPEVGK
jgi:hypothetical protein